MFSFWCRNIIQLLIVHKFGFFIYCFYFISKQYKKYIFIFASLYIKYKDISFFCVFLYSFYSIFNSHVFRCTFLLDFFIRKDYSFSERQNGSIIFLLDFLLIYWIIFLKTFLSSTYDDVYLLN